MKIADLCVILILVVIVAGICVYLHRQKKRGGMCAGCSSCGNCGNHCKK